MRFYFTVKYHVRILSSKTAMSLYGNTILVNTCYVCSGVLAVHFSKLNKKSIFLSSETKMQILIFFETYCFGKKFKFKF